MALPPSGQLSMQDIADEINSGTPGTIGSTNIELAGGTIPQPGSLFGEANNTVDKNAPHTIDEFHGYVEATTTTTTTSTTSTTTSTTSTTTTTIPQFTVLGGDTGTNSTPEVACGDNSNTTYTVIDNDSSGTITTGDEIVGLSNGFLKIEANDYVELDLGIVQAPGLQTCSATTTSTTTSTTTTTTSTTTTTTTEAPRFLFEDVTLSTNTFQDACAGIGSTINVEGYEPEFEDNTFFFQAGTNNFIEEGFLSNDGEYVASISEGSVIDMSLCPSPTTTTTTTSTTTTLPPRFEFADVTLSTNTFQDACAGIGSTITVEGYEPEFENNTSFFLGSSNNLIEEGFLSNDGEYVASIVNGSVIDMSLCPEPTTTTTTTSTTTSTTTTTTTKAPASITLYARTDEGTDPSVQIQYTVNGGSTQTYSTFNLDDVCSQRGAGITDLSEGDIVEFFTDEDEKLNGSDSTTCPTTPVFGPTSFTTEQLSAGNNNVALTIQANNAVTTTTTTTTTTSPFQQVLVSLGNTRYEACNNSAEDILLFVNQGDFDIGEKLYEDQLGNEWTNPSNYSYATADGDPFVYELGFGGGSNKNTLINPITCPEPTTTTTTSTTTTTTTTLPPLVFVLSTRTSGNGQSTPCNDSLSPEQTMYVTGTTVENSSIIGEKAYITNSTSFPWQGQNEWYGVSDEPIPGTARYYLQIDNSGNIIDWVDCFNTPAPTPAPATPAPTPSPTPQTSFPGNVTNATTSFQACFAIADTIVYFSTSTPGNNDIVYTNPSLTSTFSGNGFSFYGVDATGNFFPDFKCNIDAFGVISNKTNC